jgi:hypothetical protein
MGPMDRPIPTRCPLCEGRVHVEKVRCEACDCAIEGTFSLDWVGQLSKEQLGFVKVFLECRGKIKDVELALGVSYPTVVSRLDEAVASLSGGQKQRNAPPPPSPALSASRLEVLEELAGGAIDVDEAERRLKRRQP